MKRSSARVVIAISTVALVGASALWLGCGGDDTTNTGTDAGKDSTAPDANGDASQNDSAMGFDTSGFDVNIDAEAGVPLDCPTYCNIVVGFCGNTPDTTQYLDFQTCLAMCPNIPLGTTADTTGNTLGCRLHYAVLAAQSSMNLATDCRPAGPYGGHICGSANECGELCALDIALCGSGNGAPYGDGGICLTNCAGYKVIDAGTVQGPNDDTLNCREYHLERAYQPTADGGDAGNAQMHCPHTSLSGGGVCTPS